MRGGRGMAGGTTGGGGAGGSGGGDTVEHPAVSIAMLAPTNRRREARTAKLDLIATILGAGGPCLMRMQH
jgi:hypothetical protein